ncbi:MAG: glycosyl hydrolase, partial [Bryobacteraceae bacterium]
QDDRAPYIYRTTDYGKTWKTIVEGIRAGDYVHAVREDTTRPGLLYAGTEHGFYVSFDDGDHWQSLSLNLPDTQVSDIVVQGDDVVIATHGRSFYVLDDVSPLRQLSAEVAQTANLHLFTPETAIRRTQPLTVNYFLKEKASKVTVEILDARGKVIRGYVGEPEDPNKPREGAAGGGGGFRRQAQKPGFEAGLNRFTWDMRYPGATVFPGMILWGASAEQGPLAVPGNYQVRVTAAGVTQTQAFRIIEDPRSTATQADLQAEFDLAMQIRDKVSMANQAVIDVRKVRPQITDRLGKTQAADLHSAGDVLTKKLTDVEEAIYQVRNRSGQDPLNFPIKLNNKIAHIQEVVEDGDYKPTDQSYAAVKELAGELDVQLAKLKAIMGADLEAFNKLLAANNLDAVKLGAGGEK